jgi:hypothetical protein
MSKRRESTRVGRPPDSLFGQGEGNGSIYNLTELQTGSARPLHSMLALLGLATVLILLALIMSRLMSPLVALILVPVAAAMVAGAGLTTAQFIAAGIQQTAAVAAMFVFAILYFGIMSDGRSTPTASP